MNGMNGMYRTLLAVVALAASSMSVSAETITVPVGGDIQAAIDSAETGDTIQLEAGIYEISETLAVEVPITIAGADELGVKGTSVIDAGRRCRVIQANADLELRSIVLQNGMAGFPSSYSEDDEPADPDGDPCDFEPSEDGDDDGGGIFAIGSITMHGCEVVGCRASSYGGAVFAGGNVVLVDCVLRDNTAAYGGGIWSNGQFETIVISMTGCALESLSACRGAVLYAYSSSVSMADCTVIDCRGDALFANTFVGRPFQIESSIICDNNRCGLDWGALRYRFDEESCICSSLLDQDEDGIPDDCENQDHSIAAIIHAAIDAGDADVQLPPGRFDLAAPLALGYLQNPLQIRGDPDGGTELSGRDIVPIVLLSQGGDLCRIADVNLTHGFGYAGGAISSFFAFASLALENVNLESCVARQGGGVHAYLSSLVFDDVIFNECSAYDGNALRLDPRSSSTSVQISDTEFIGGFASGAVVTIDVSQTEEVGTLEFLDCRWVLESSPDSIAIRVDGELKKPNLFGNLVQCQFIYPEEGQRVVQGRLPWQAVDCDFSFCCPFESVASNAIAEGSGNLWRCESCPGDVTCDSSVNAADLGRLLSAWDTTEQRYDLNDDGIVKAADLGILLSSWGPCQ